MTKKIARVLAALALGVTSALVAGAPAPALAGPYSQYLDRSGTVDEEEFIFYYNSSQYGYGSLSDFYYNVSDLSGYKFLGAGSGKGQYVKNNAAACWNTHNYDQARVYYNSGYQGLSDTFTSNVRRNLVSALKNENASFRWI